MVRGLSDVATQILSPAQIPTYYFATSEIRRDRDRQTRTADVASCVGPLALGLVTVEVLVVVLEVKCIGRERGEKEMEKGEGTNGRIPRWIPFRAGAEWMGLYSGMA